MCILLYGLRRESKKSGQARRAARARMQVESSTVRRPSDLRAHYALVVRSGVAHIWYGRTL
eukprot:1768997-Prymnesium_polylepis.1